FLGYYDPAKESIPNLKHLVTAGPLLVLEGQPLWQGVVEGFRGSILKRAARTAVGVNKQGHLLFVVVDGRQKDFSAGLSLEEMAYLMVDLGAQSAAALDGGGSSAIWVKDKIVNRPSDGKERKIANAFLILHQVPVYLNEKHLFFDAPPEIEKGRVLVPLRGIFEALQAKVDWDQSTATVTAVLEDKTILLTMGKQEALINEQKVWLGVPPQIRAGRTMVPLRFVSEALGAKVIWQNNPPAIFINK
ncbi:MAG TPA: copper amine oxidase, partial [Desulfotomaculum sp.]|nr:copper amine oxidase [Desulfotomaculum sp.]